MIWRIWTDDQWSFRLKGNAKSTTIFAINRHEAEYKARMWFITQYGFSYRRGGMYNYIDLKVQNVTQSMFPQRSTSI